MQRSAFLLIPHLVKVKGWLKKLHLINCILVVDIILICDLLEPASHKQHAEQFNKRPTLCIKDPTRWQIAIATGTLNPIIVFQSCCPVIYSCCSATVSVLEFFNALFTESIMFSHENMTPRVWALLYCMCQREGARDRTGRTRKVREIGIDRWTDGWAQWEA